MGQELEKRSGSGGLMASQYYQPLENGVRFQLDAEGKLLPIPRAEFTQATKDLEFWGSGINWWLGDMANAIAELYGGDAVAEFASEVHKDIAEIQNLMTTSRKYGWPNQIEAQRQKGLSHTHHELAQAFTDVKQRSKYLRTGLDRQMNQKDFYEFVKLKKKGPGATDKDDPEYPVFKPKFRAFNTKTDNAEQFLAEFIEKVTKEEFPAYLDPTGFGKELEAKRTRAKLVAEFSDEIQAELLTAGADLDDKAFEKLVGERKTKDAEVGKIDSLAKRLSEHKNTSEEDKAKIAELVAAAKETGQSLEDFKKDVETWATAQKARRKDLTTIEGFVGQIKDETKRKELLDRVHAENLSLDQVKPLAKEILADEMLAEDIEKRKQEIDASLDKKFEPKTKVAKPATDTSGLKLSKKPAAKKGGAKKTAEKAKAKK